MGKYNLEESSVVIKPDGVPDAKAIFRRLDSPSRKRILTAGIKPVPLEFIRELYLPLAGKEFYEPYVNSFCGEEAIFSVYQGYGVIQELRDLIGATEPAKARPGTIRKEFGGEYESFELARSRGRMIRNVVHSSDPENANREVALTKKMLIYVLDSLLSTPPANRLACPTFFISAGGIRCSYS